VAARSGHGIAATGNAMSRDAQPPTTAAREPAAQRKPAGRPRKPAGNTSREARREYDRARQKRLRAGDAYRRKQNASLAERQRNKQRERIHGKHDRSIANAVLAADGLSVVSLREFRSPTFLVITPRPGGGSQDTVRRIETLEPDLV